MLNGYHCIQCILLGGIGKKRVIHYYIECCCTGEGRFRNSDNKLPKTPKLHRSKYKLVPCIAFSTSRFFCCARPFFDFPGIFCILHFSAPSLLFHRIESVAVDFSAQYPPCAMKNGHELLSIALQVVRKIGFYLSFEILAKQSCISTTATEFLFSFLRSLYLK